MQAVIPAGRGDTLALGLALFAMGEDWSYAIAVVGSQLVFTLVIGPLTVFLEARQTNRLRRMLEMQSLGPHRPPTE